ncbi:MAG TPA: glycosyltransferase family 4 protein [Anaerolineales bacterium]|nr:glycosyltransferase family 4 protein [Anaerolineales bacterium]
MNQFYIFILFTLLSYSGVYLIRYYAEKRQLLDAPNERSSHSTPTPRGGGWMIVLLVTGAGLWSVIAAGFDTLNRPVLSHELLFIVCGIIIAWLGWRDDLHSLSPRLRFSVQSIVALTSILGFGYFKAVTIPLFGELQLGVVGFIITFLWIVGLTNAYNFMDGIDGMAGGVAFAGGIGWMLLSANMQNTFAFWIALAISASSLGFLFHNWSPAKIFMGDVASTFLGYTFAVLPLLSADQGGDALMLGTLLMWTFIMDAGITFIRRALQREELFTAHRTHLYQRLVIGGYKHSTISLLYILLTLLAGILSYAWSWGRPYAPPLIILGLPLIWILLSRHASRLRSAAPESKE